MPQRIHWIYPLVVILACGNFPGVLAQDTGPQSGFAVITPTGGTFSGLTAAATLIQQTAAGPTRVVVPPAVPLTSAAMLVSLGPMAQGTSALSLLNLSASEVQVNLQLSAGDVIANQSLILGPNRQIARFLNELVPAHLAPDARRAMLLTLHATGPVAVLGLDFTETSFTPLPMGIPAITPTVGTPPVTTPATGPVAPIQPMPGTMSTGLPPNFGFGSGFGSGFGGVGGIGVGGAGIGIGIGVAPTAAPPPQVLPAPLSVASAPGTIVFTQVVSGGGWETEITIGNTSGVQQAVRIDFFDSDGNLRRTIGNLIIPPAALVVVSPN